MNAIRIFTMSGRLLDIAWSETTAYDLGGADLRKANLRGADLSGADLRGTNLGGANLSEANLIGADLRGTNLGGANLSEANLSGADLRWADLGGADLRGADLRWADLSGADLSGTDTFSLGNCQRGYRFLLRDASTDAPRIQAGCRDFTIAEARVHWETAHVNNPLLRAEILAKLDMADAIIAAARKERKGR